MPHNQWEAHTRLLIAWIDKQIQAVELKQMRLQLMITVLKRRRQLIEREKIALIVITEIMEASNG